MTQLALREAVPLAHALVARVARDSDVRVLFIKGPQAVAQGLRRPRTSVDVDVLVDPARRAMLAAALARFGWVDDNPRRTPTIMPRHSLTVRQPTWPCELDLHDYFPGFFADHQHVFETLWARRTHVDLAGCDLTAPDVSGHALVLALHALRDPHDAYKRNEVVELAATVAEQLDDDELQDLADLAVELGAADTAAPFLAMVGAPETGRGSTSADDLRAWRLRTLPTHTTTISWVTELRRLPWYRWPQYLWWAAVLSEEELRLADPTMPPGRRAVWDARRRRLRRGLAAMPEAVASIRTVRLDAGAEEVTDSPTARVVSAGARRPRVVIVQEILTAYRVPFYERLRERLLAAGVELVLVHGFPAGPRASRGDQGTVPWAVTTDNRHLSVFPGRTPLVWQPLPRSVVRRADVVVIEQANRQLVNYLLLLRAALRHRPRVVFWGHGANLQVDGLLGQLGEGFKRSISRRAHWWLAYTEGSADRVAAFGFPRDRITVVQNAVEVTVPTTPVDRVPGQCVYVGSLYSHKRIAFLVEAARRTAALRDDFRLVVIGDGEDRPMLEEAAAREPWLEVRGPMFGDETMRVLAASNLLLMPGLVGLAIVDSFATGCPMVTVDLPLHSPEIEYLRDGVNGVVLPAGATPEQYGERVARLLGDEATLDRLREGCAVSAATYTVDAMVKHFAEGLLAALE